MISEKELQAAARKCEKAMMDSLPDPDECDAVFSPKFERKMKKLILQTDHPFRYWIQKSVACFLLIVLLGGGGLITFSTEVRAAFFGWIREFYADHFEYHYVGDNQNTPRGIIYRPTWIPDGYEATSESHDPGYGCIIYRNGNEEMIGFTWSEDIESSVSHVYPETAEIKNTFIGDNPADLYLEHGEGLSSCLVWSNREERVLFVISATLSEDEIIQMAESVEVQSTE